MATALSAALDGVRSAPGAIARDTAALTRNLRRSRHVLWSLTAIECRRKYAGSILGLFWYPLYSSLLLGSYCFVYLVVFRVRYREFSTYDFVLFICAGRIPYLGFSEAVSTGLGSVKANLALLRNAVFPIEFVPVKHVLAALVGLLSSLALLILMIAPTRYLGWHLLYLPVPLILLLLFTLAVVWLLSAVAVVVPDVAQIVNIALLLFMFVSPIGYSVDMVPERVRLLVYLNPMTWLIDAFRYALLGLRSSPGWYDALFLGVSALAAAASGAFFRRMSPIFSDYE